MSDWSQERLQTLILLPQEEDTRHEYKSAESLRFSDDNRKSEFRKDVSAMANSAGGMIVYGMIERKDGSRVLPDRLESVDSMGTTKETLYQVLDSVQRRIDGVKIEPVDLTSGGYVYVVEVPQSNTIHMCEGGSLKYAGKYFTRRGNRVSAMEDHEVRMGLNRSVHPYLELEFFWGQNPVTDQWGRGMITGHRLSCILKHSGGPLAEKIMLELQIPAYWTNDPQPFAGHKNRSEYFNNFIAATSVFVPLFPERQFSFHLSLRDDFWDLFGGGGQHPLEIIKWSLSVDSAALRRGDIAVGTLKWE